MYVSHPHAALGALNDKQLAPPKYTFDAGVESTHPDDIQAVPDAEVHSEEFLVRDKRGGFVSYAVLITCVIDTVFSLRPFVQLPAFQTLLAWFWAQICCAAREDLSKLRKLVFYLI